jgi:hypothetical protein
VHLIQQGAHRHFRAPRFHRSGSVHWLTGLEDVEFTGAKVVERFASATDEFGNRAS